MKEEDLNKEEEESVCVGVGGGGERGATTAMARVGPPGPNREKIEEDMMSSITAQGESV